jgi:hypothetical protein
MNSETSAAKSGGAGALQGAIAAVLLAFPAAALMALCYQFPVPFAGQLSGLEGAAMSLWAVFFYGVFLMGFIPLAIVGALVGVLTGGGDSDSGSTLWVVLFVVDLVAAFVLANLNF